MKIQNIFPQLKTEIGKLEISGISDDSRLVKKGDLFFVREGGNFDIFSVLKTVENKVAGFVAETKNKKKIQNFITKAPVIYVEDIQREFFRAVNSFYGFNKNNFKFIGVTGTKGKTTTAHLTYYLLEKFNQKASLIGTVNYIIEGKVYNATHTTPDFLSLRKIFSAIKGGYVVMEVSSHGIEQERIKGIDFLRCAFTNLSREHLDYHKIMESYFKVKKGFFIQNKDAVSIVNADDIYGRRILSGLKNKISYGMAHKARLKANNIHLSKKGIEFELIYGKKSFLVKTCLLGRHNVLNILAAVGVMVSLDFPLKDIIGLIPSFEGVEGRLQEIKKGIFVDYAHTPDSLEKALLAVKEIGYKKIICVFGCGGNRDKGKREIMGAISSRLADFTFITSDNPRNEDPKDICRQIQKGFKKNNYCVVVDRKIAIEKALKLKNKYKDSCLLVAGKGHEDYQIVGNKRLHFKDSKVITQLINKC